VNGVYTTIAKLILRASKRVNDRHTVATCDLSSTDGDFQDFVANRGEIAVRIIRGPRLGIQTVQAVVAADGSMLPAPHTDETVPVGRARSRLASCHK
jgi:hypothetical protein